MATCLTALGIGIGSVTGAGVASATTPGTPGTPQPGTPVYSENFSNQNATAGAISILNYTGGAAAAGMTYTADTPYTPAGNQCDGWILNASTPLPSTDSGCTNNEPAGWGQIQQIATQLGVAQGQTPAQAASNQALSEYTNNASGAITAGTEFQTVSSSAIPAIGGHYYAVSAYFGEVNCFAAHAKETFSLIINGTPTILSSGLDPCGTDTTSAGVVVENLQSAAIQIPTGATPSLGLSLYNATTTGSGNDVAFDLPQIVDVTPQLDKAFSPATIAQGGTSTLTLTVTNTDDLAAKNGWNFTDQLPTNVVLAATPNPTTTCLNPAGTATPATITAAPGATSIAVNGSLSKGMASCTITVQVTSNVVGVYTNSAPNFTTLTGLNPPGPAVLTVTPVVDLSIVKTANIASYTPGSPITYTVTVKNAASTAANPVSTATNATVSDPIPASITGAGWTCAASAGATCAGGSGSAINDTVTIPAGGQIVYTVTGTVAAGTTGNLVNSATVAPPGGTTDTNCPTGTGCTSTVTTPGSSIGVVKSITSVTDANTDGLVDAGDVIHYSIVTTNTGQSSLTNVKVVDVLTAPAGPALTLACLPSVPAASLAPGAKITCTANYTITTADVDHGAVDNTVSSTGTPPSGPDVKATDSAHQPTATAGTITVVKTADVTAITTVGQTVTYSFKVTNTGPVTLTNINVTDLQASPATQANLSVITCPLTTLAAGASTTCTATYVVTQADLNSGSLKDTAIAHGTTPTGTTVDSPPSTVTIPAVQTPKITVVKSAAEASFATVGDVVHYSFLVTNTGNVTLTGITVTDVQASPATQANLSAITCPVTALAAGASTTCTATYTITQTDLDHGNVKDAATSHGTPPTGGPVDSPPSTVTVPAVQGPALSVVKKATETKFTAVGDVVHYSFLVTNTGNVNLTSINVTDVQTSPATQANLSAVTCPVTALAPQASTTCTATYTVTQGDLTNGNVKDTAVANGTPPTGTPVDSPPSTVTVAGTQTPAITVVKSAAETKYAAVGAVIHYSFLVTNTGNVPLSGVNVTDVQQAPAEQANLSAILCPATTLAPGASTTCAATYTVTQADLTNGSVNDTAIAHGTPPTGAPVDSPPSTATVGATQTPAITIVKNAAEANFDAVGDVIHYTFRVTNTGNVPLTSVNVTDVQTSPAGALDGPILCPATTLAPGASTTCTATYTITQTDLDHGNVKDAATSHGTPPTGGPVDSPPSTVTVPAVQGPALSVVKKATETKFTAVGDVVHYSFLVTNTGNVNLTSINVTDVQTSPATQANLSAVTCSVTALAPQASTTCTANYQITQADLNNGSVTDAAVAHGTPPSGTPVDSPPSTVTVAGTQTPAITVVKSAAETKYAAVGAVIRYSFLVTNTGNVPLSGVNVTDVQTAPAGALDGPILCLATTLAPGVSTTCAATYTVTQADLDHGSVHDVAQSHGTPPTIPGVPAPTPVDSGPSQVTVPAVQTPQIDVVKKAAEPSYANVGDVIHYTFLVTNSGNVILDHVNVTDVQADPAGALDGPVVCPVVKLAPNATATCSATYTITQADLDNGSVNDTATSHGTPPTGAPVGSPPSTVTVPAVQGPALSVVKTALEPQYDAVGDVIHYSFLVSNVGNVTLTSVNVADQQVAPAVQANMSAILCPATTLAPKAHTVCTGTYTITQADLTNGSVKDAATAHGTPPTGSPVDSPPSTVTVPAVQKPSVTVVKKATQTDFKAVGDVIDYTFTVTNTGNVPLTDVKVSDVQAAPATVLDGPVVCPATVLAPAASMTCAASYTITQADLDHGSVQDAAAATGTPPTGPPVDSPPSTVTVPAADKPALTVVKMAGETTFDAVGNVINYSFRVTNTGNVTMTAINVTDVQASPAGHLDHGVACPQDVLAPGASITCTATYTITAADLTHGSVADTATAHGTPPGTMTPVNSPPSTVTVRGLSVLPTSNTTNPPTSPAPAPAPLAYTGVGHLKSMLTYGSILLILGVAALVLGRRRRRNI